MRVYGQVTGNLRLALCNIVDILPEGRVPPFQMIEGVITDSMSCCKNFLENPGMLSDIVADAKESGLSFVFLQLIEDEFGWAGNGAIIKSQKKFFLPGRNAPQQRRVNFGKKKRGSK